jgi:hypothetical protein
MNQGLFGSLNYATQADSSKKSMEKKKQGEIDIGLA